MHTKRKGINMKNSATISLPAAISIGVGGMIGAGIFSILGIAAMIAGAAVWLSFLIGGIIALTCTYSYAKLGAKFPSRGGAVQFLVEGFGAGLFSSSVNLFMWIGYIIAIALYAQGFAAYFMTFFTHPAMPWLSKSIASAAVLLFTAINILGDSSVGKAELLIVTIKVGILIFFAAVGLCYVHPENLVFSKWSNWEHICFGAGVIFIGYEGFGLIANTAADISEPSKNLPRALYISLFLVIAIYIAVSITLVGNLSPAQIVHSGDYALAEAAKPFLGMLGFKIIALAALLSTASAINATLFGAANVSYMIARDGELSSAFERSTWKNATGGLLMTSLLTIIFILFFDLNGVAMMGSGAFLLIYAAVNAGHIKIIGKTQANKALVLLSLILCLVLFIILEIYTYQQAPLALYTMIALICGCFVFQYYYKKIKSHRE